MERYTFQYKAFFLFAGLLAIDMIIFSVMAYFYKYREVTSKKDDSEQETTAMTGKDNEGFAETTNF